MLSLRTALAVLSCQRGRWGEVLLYIGRVLSADRYIFLPVSCKLSPAVFQVQVLAVHSLMLLVTTVHKQTAADTTYEKLSLTFMQPPSISAATSPDLPTITAIPTGHTLLKSYACTQTQAPCPVGTRCIALGQHQGLSGAVPSAPCPE